VAPRRGQGAEEEKIVETQTFQTGGEDGVGGIRRESEVAEEVQVAGISYKAFLVRSV
jgi:hypothetical protein